MAREGVETAVVRLTRERVAAEAVEVDCHELFLVQDADDLPIAHSIVNFISIVRLAPVRENAGRAWDSVALPNSQALRDTFGGGTYMVRALTAKRNPIPGGTRHYQFPGPSFPMDGSGPPKAPEEPLAAPLAAAAPVYAPAPQGPDLRGIGEIIRPFAEQAAAAQARSDALMLKLVELAGRGGAPAPAATGVAAMTPEAIQTAIEAGAEKHLGRFLDGFTQAQDLMKTQYKAIEEAKAAGREEGKGEGGDEDIKLLRELVPFVGPMLGKANGAT